MISVNILKNIKPVTDTDEQLRHHILWFLFIRVVLYTLLLGITFLLHTKEHRLILPPLFFILAYLFLIYSYSIGSALLLPKIRVHLRRFGMVQILSDTLFIALLVYGTGCSQSIFTIVFILPIIAGGLILYRMGGLIPAAASTILYGIILTGEYLRYIPSYFYTSRYAVVEDYFQSMNFFAVYGLIFFLIAMLSGILAQRLRSAEDALTMTERKFDRLLFLYKQIFDDIMTGIITVDDRDRITSINPAAENITGFSSAEISGKPLPLFFPQISAEKQSRKKADVRRKDGSLIRIGYSCSELHMAPDPESSEAPYTSCKVITLQDISRFEQMERQMRKAEKMAAIGKLSASIAHDFRNPLAAISGSAQILLMDQEKNNTAPADGTNKSLTNIILRESERMARTINDFLDYARPTVPDRQWFNLLRLARETVDQVKGGAACSGCTVKLDIPPNLDLCADRQLLQLALSHLLNNSCHAARNTSEPIEIAAREETDDGNSVRIIIEVRDRGEGFDPALADKLFDPFFSTREDATGLGLSIVKQIVAGHSGSVAMANLPAGGCAVSIDLPLPETTP
ncbi:MAG: ATP-binding protein [Desulfobulbaceae bacterium]|jgi:two-component system sensor histidine kinase PilS (NtrC family)|nr:ATP-binding protein [Desulfobulbaceae bacterium]MDY0350753.1 ATP-binding protein [Desulfobulbaceae bacterium]